MDTLETNVRETIRKYDMLSHGESILIAVSGGPDSVALLHVLTEWKDQLDLRLGVAHLQHGTRGDESRADALFVAGIAGKLGIPFYLEEVDLPGAKTARGRGNLEAMGREARYRFFAGVADGQGFQKVAVGHTRDDQVETILMRLLRGSGRRGLAGIPPVRPLEVRRRGSGETWLVRPLMESSRQDILNYLMKHNLDYRVDRTNLDTALLRNWVRLILLPQLRQKAGVGFDARLAGLAETWRDEEIILERLTEERLDGSLEENRMPRLALLREPKGMQRRLLRGWWERTRGDLRGIGSAHVESARFFLRQGCPQGSLSLPGSWELAREYDRLHLRRRQARRVKPADYSYELPLDGSLSVPEARVRFQCIRSTVSRFFTPSQLGVEAHFDQAGLPDLLTVRNFRPGDRFRPFGMQGHKKLKELFIEKRVPRALRLTVPIVVSGGEVLWIPNYGRSDIARVTEDTSELLTVKIENCVGL